MIVIVKLKSKNKKIIPPTRRVFLLYETKKVNFNFLFINMEILTGEKAGERYQLMINGLTKNQVLVPKLRAVQAPPELGEGRYGGQVVGQEIVGWTIKNIRKLSFGQIEKVMIYAPEQLTEEKLNHLVAREERLRGMRNLS